MIARQCVRQTFLPHHGERNTVGERPLFVGTLELEGQTAVEKFMTGLNDFHVTVVLQKFNQFPEAGPGVRNSGCIAHFSQHPLGGCKMKGSCLLYTSIWV